MKKNLVLSLTLILLVVSLMLNPSSAQAMDPQRQLSSKGPGTGCQASSGAAMLASCAEVAPVIPVRLTTDFVVFLPTVMNNVVPTIPTQEQTKSTVNTSVYSDQKFGDIPLYSTYLADDFLVGSEGLHIEEFFFPGHLYNNGTTLANATQLVFQIYGNNGGLPAGDPVNGGAIWTLSVPPSDSRITLTQGSPNIYGNVKLTFSTPLFLPAGRYWIVFYPEMNVITGQYGRYVSDSTNGYDAVVMNPGGGFLPNATSWTSIQPTASWGLAQQDLAFRVKGY